MSKSNWVKKISVIAMCAASVFAVSSANAASTDPVDMLYNFQATGQYYGYDSLTGKTTYAISAVGTAPNIKGNGIIRTSKHDGDDDDYKVVLTDAKITFDKFDFANPSPVVNFSCAGCKLSFPDGSTLSSDPNVPLEGRALFLYGPVAPNPDTPNLFTIRMAGCSGLHETAGVGKLANKVGTICFNGVFNFDTNNLAGITGSSNCTIVTHTPVQQ